MRAVKRAGGDFPRAEEVVLKAIVCGSCHGAGQDNASAAAAQSQTRAAPGRAQGGISWGEFPHARANTLAQYLFCNFNGCRQWNLNPSVIIFYGHVEGPLAEGVSFICGPLKFRLGEQQIVPWRLHLSVGAGEIRDFVGDASVRANNCKIASHIHAFVGIAPGVHVNHQGDDHLADYGGFGNGNPGPFPFPPVVVKTKIIRDDQVLSLIHI